jgi:hypothetical protein
MCFVFVWVQATTCVTYTTNWLVFITEMKSVYSAVRIGPLNKAICAASFKGLETGFKRNSLNLKHNNHEYTYGTNTIHKLKDTIKYHFRASTQPQPFVRDRKPAKSRAFLFSSRVGISWITFWILALSSSTRRCQWVSKIRQHNRIATCLARRCQVNEVTKQLVFV